MIGKGKQSVGIFGKLKITSTHHTHENLIFSFYFQSNEAIYPYLVLLPCLVHPFNPFYGLTRLIGRAGRRRELTEEGLRRERERKLIRFTFSVFLSRKPIVPTLPYTRPDGPRTLSEGESGRKSFPLIPRLSGISGELLTK